MRMHDHKSNFIL